MAAMCINAEHSGAVRILGIKRKGRNGCNGY